MEHFTTPDFWQRYYALPEHVRTLANKNFDLLKADPSHPSLQFKNIESVWSVRVGLHYRALAIQRAEGFVWFWIGSHADYDKLID